MIRPLKMADLDVVMQIWLEGNLQAHDFIVPEYWRQNYDFVKNILPQSTVYVYEDGQIKGFIGLEDDFIAGIFVRRDCRGQGVGRQLLDFVKDQKHRLQLTVYEKNASAVEFYKQNGFTLISDRIDPATDEKEFLMQWKALY